jgi:hypothetical protein
MNISESVEKLANWQWYEVVASDILSPRIEVISWEEADKPADLFTISTASPYELSTSKLILLDLKRFSWFTLFVKRKQRCTKLCHETTDPACKMAVNCVTKTTDGRHLISGKTDNSVTPQAVWPLRKH